MEAYYQKAIDIITTEQDWKGICIAIAKTSPQALCDALNYIPWQVEAKRINVAEGKIAAIKYIRKEKGFGLKEAKETIEKLAEQP